MRFPIPWVTATTFGFVGFSLALSFAVLILGVKSVHWVFLPAVLASAAATYSISTWLGVLAARAPHGLLISVLIGIGVALVTLMVGVAAFGLGNILLGWLGEVASAYSDGRRVYISISGDIYAYVLKPIGAVLLYGGGLMAPILGTVYGFLLHETGDAKRAHQPANSDVTFKARITALRKIRLIAVSLAIYGVYTIWVMMTYGQPLFLLLWAVTCFLASTGLWLRKPWSRFVVYAVFLPTIFNFLSHGTGIVLSIVAMVLGGEPEHAFPTQTLVTFISSVLWAAFAIWSIAVTFRFFHAVKVKV